MLTQNRSCVWSAFLATVAMVSAASNARASDQPQWGERYTRNMVSDEKGLPESFDLKTGRNVKWVVQLGTETHATPAISGGRVMVGTNNNRPRDPKHSGDRGVLMCFREKDGAFLWQLVVPKNPIPDIYLDWPGTGICSTPTMEGNRIYVMDNLDEVLCLDCDGMANGNDGPYQDEGRHMTPQDRPPLTPGPTDADILWATGLVKEAGIYPHDEACASALIYGPYIYINSCNGVDNTHRKVRSPDAPSLVVLEKSTGKYVGRDNENIGPRIFHATWSPPALGMVNGKPQIIFCGCDGVVYAFEPLAAPSPDGRPISLKLVWKFDCDPTAPKENVHLYTSNTEVSPSDILSTPVFHNNRVYVTVGGDLWWGKKQAWLKCIDATGRGDVTGKGEIWSYPLSRHVIATPAVKNGLVYAADCGHIIHCVDEATGKPCWTHEASSEIWASPLVADGKVYVASCSGDLLVFKAGRTKKLLFQASFNEAINATPVAANDTLYVTTMTKLYALRNSGK